MATGPQTAMLVVGAILAVGVTPPIDCKEIYLYENGKGASASILLTMPTSSDVQVTRPAGDLIVLKAISIAWFRAGVTYAWLLSGGGSLNVAVEYQ